jgi:GntR family transcriptional regulator
MSLEISIVTGSTAPIYRQIADQIGRAVATGKLPPGEQMASVRALAEELMLNPNTVGRAYAELIREGVLDGQQGKGVFVAQRRNVYSKAERLRRLRGTLEAFVNEGLRLGFSPDELRDVLERNLQRLAASAENGGQHE